MDQNPSREAEPQAHFDPEVRPAPPALKPSRTTPGGGIMAADSPHHAAPAVGPDAFALFRAMQRRWVLALLSGVVAGGLVATGVWFLMPPAKYRARAMLLVATKPPLFIFDTHPNIADYGTYQRTQVALIK